MIILLYVFVYLLIGFMLATAVSYVDASENPTQDDVFCFFLILFTWWITFPVMLIVSSATIVSNYIRFIHKVRNRNK